MSLFYLFFSLVLGWLPKAGHFLTVFTDRKTLTEQQLARLRFLWIALGAVGLLILLFQLMGIRVNFTGSMPIGIYQQCHHTKIHRGDIISFCLPKRMALVGKSQGYISSGPCPGNAMRLLKQVIAVPADEVALSSNFIRVNGHRYFTPQQAVNHNGRHIFHWVKNGIYHNIKTVWVYGSHDPVHSWDSRYFGGIPMNAIQGLYREL